MHLRNTASNMENEATSAFPQFYADRFGWQEMVDQVTRIVNGLSPADRARVGILCSNYGEASAINFLGAGRGLPFAISGHNNYWIWGPHGETGDVIIVINGASLDEMRKYYDFSRDRRRDEPPLRHALRAPQHLSLPRPQRQHREGLAGVQELYLAVSGMERFRGTRADQLALL